ncbi:annexin D4 [Lactuca sativa]|nr:annexin D4 [Lactuca sativa]
MLLLLLLFYPLLEPTFFYGEVCRWFRKMVQPKINMMNKDDFFLFHKLYIAWSQDPWERDAFYIREAFLAGPTSYNVIMEITCTRSSYELVAIKKAYHSLFKTNLDEDVARYITSAEIEHKLLTALVRGYRDEGSVVNEKHANSDALTIYSVLSVPENPLLDDYVVMILASRSILHIKSVLRHYQETTGSSLYDELGTTYPIMKDTLQCLCSPSSYFCKVIEAAMQVPGEANETRKEDLARVIVTRADVDMKNIKQEFYRKNGVTLSQRIFRTGSRNYIEFLSMLITMEEDTEIESVSN